MGPRMHWEGECVWVGGASPSPHPDRNSALGRQRSPGTERQRRADAEGLGWALGGGSGLHTLSLVHALSLVCTDCQAANTREPLCRAGKVLQMAKGEGGANVWDGARVIAPGRGSPIWLRPGGAKLFARGRNLVEVSGLTRGSPSGEGLGLELGCGEGYQSSHSYCSAWPAW